MLKYFVILFIFIQTAVHAAQVAIVQVPKAILYSDQNLKSPIGFVRRGQQLWVGDVKRRRGTILPVAVNGQIAWIRLIDLDIGQSMVASTQRSVKRNIEVEDEDSDLFDPLDKNNFLQVRLIPISPSLDGVSNGNGDTSVTSENPSGSSVSVLFEHRHPLKNINWGFGLDYYQFSSETFAYETLALKGLFEVTPFRFSLFEIDLFAGPMISADFRVSSKDIGTYKGTLYGFEAGAVARLLSSWKIGVAGGVVYQSMKFVNLDAIENDNDANEDALKGASLLSAFFALTYRF